MEMPLNLVCTEWEKSGPGPCVVRDNDPPQHTTLSSPLGTGGIEGPGVGAGAQSDEKTRAWVPRPWP